MDLSNNKSPYRTHPSIFDPGLRRQRNKKFEIVEGAPWERQSAGAGSKMAKKKPTRCTIPGSGVFRDFCNETTIHGFNHIVARNRHPIEKFGWLAATALAVLGAVQLCLQQWNRFVANPTVVSLEKDYRAWNNTFLALTACVEVRVVEDLAARLVERRWGAKEGDEKFRYYMDFIDVLTKMRLSDLAKFEKYAEDKTLESVDLLDLTLQVTPPFKGILAWFDKNINASFVPVMTEMGICYTLNSVVSVDQAVKIPLYSGFNPPETPIACQYITHPCYMRVELYAVCTEYYAHSPYEIIDSTSERLTVACPGMDVNTDWKVIDTKASEDVKALAIDQRNCRFHTEGAQKQQSVYSGGICRRECKNKIAMKYCSCRPYFYPQEYGTQCNIAGMLCIEKYRDKIAKMEGCTCLPQCVDATYELATLKESLWTGPFSTRSSVKIGILPPRSRYKRQILFCFEDLVVSFGGAAGLFLGCSFLSAVEIVYFFAARIVTFVLGRFGFGSKVRPPTVEPDDASTLSEATEDRRLRARKRTLPDLETTLRGAGDRFEMRRFIDRIAEYEK